MKLSPKTYLLLSAAILIAAVLAVAVFWHFSPKEISVKEEQPADSQKIQTADPPAPSSGQGDQAVQADQISAIDQSAEENLGGDYKIEGASFVAEPKEKNGVKVQVGDKSAKEVLPEVTLSRWDETKMKIRPKALDGIAAKDQLVSFEKDKIKFDTPKVAYSLENLPVSGERPEGGFEYNIILKEKPATNVVSLGIETENLDFFYQPALTPEEIKQGASRPDDVVGSYAVYYKDGKSGDYTALGGKNYMAGKAFHIYRPRIDDAAGNWTWGGLHIDEKAGLLTVTIPQDFLDKAVYPVRHAAGLEFGYTTAGTTDYVSAASTTYWLARAYSTPASDGNLNSLSAYSRYSATSGQFVPALYSNNAGAPGSRLASVDSGTALGATYAWITTNLSYTGLVAGTQYWLGFHTPSNVIWVKLDTGNAGDANFITAAAWPASWSGGTARSWRISIYATYTPAATGGTPINIKSNVNFGNNVNLK